MENKPETLLRGVWFGVYHNRRYAVARNAGDAAQSCAETVVIPAGTYAVFTSEKGGFAGDILPRMRRRSSEKTLCDAGYAPVDGVEIEAYHLFEREQKGERYYEYRVPATRRITST